MKKPILSLVFMLLIFMLFADSLPSRAETAEDWKTKGVTYYRAGDFDKALECFELSQRIDPCYARSICNTGLVYYSKKLYNKALEFYNKTLELIENKKDTSSCPLELVYANMSRAYISLNNIGDGMLYADKAVAINPKNTAALFAKSSALFNKNDYKGSIDYSNRIIEIDPANIDALIIKGWSEISLQKNSDALLTFTIADQKLPNSYGILTGRSSALCGLARYDEALPICRKVTELYPRAPEGWSLQGLVLTELKLYNEAIKCFDKALSIEPTNKLALDGKKNIERIANSCNNFNNEDQNNVLEGILGEQVPGYCGSGTSTRVLTLKNGEKVWVTSYRKVKIEGIGTSSSIPMNPVEVKVYFYNKRLEIPNDRATKSFVKYKYPSQIMMYEVNRIVIRNKSEITKDMDLPNDFINLLKTAGMKFKLPSGYIPVKVVKNPDCQYFYAIESEKGDIEIRYTGFSITEDRNEYINYKKEGKDGVYIINPNSLSYIDSINLMTSLNISEQKESASDVTYFPENDVKTDYNADTGMIRLVSGVRKSFCDNFKYCSVTTIHKNSIAIVSVLILFNDLESATKVFMNPEIYYALKFK